MDRAGALWLFAYRPDQGIPALQEAKRGLAESIINASQSLVRDLDRETLEMLLS